MPNKWEPSDPDDLIQCYAAGNSIKHLAAVHGVGRITLTKWLTQQGVPIRGWTEANKIIAANSTPEQRRLNSLAGQRGIKGKPRPDRCVEKHAKTLESKARVSSPYELLLMEWLRDLNPTPLKACGRYNIDLAVGPVAVEVFGGNWHANGRHAARHPVRTRYLLDQGWFLVFVWITGQKPIGPDLAKYLRAAVDLAEGDPSVRGQYRVVWGTGEDVTALCPDFHERPRVPPTIPNLNSGA